MSAFHRQLVGRTGTEEQVAEAAENFRTWYDRVEDVAAPDGYLMAHQGYIYLMHPDGRFEAVFLESSQTPEALAEEILLRLDEEDQAG